MNGAATALAKQGSPRFTGLTGREMFVIDPVVGVSRPTEQMTGNQSANLAAVPLPSGVIPMLPALGGLSLVPRHATR